MGKPVAVKKVGTLAKEDIPMVNREPTGLIRTISKGVQERGSERSDRMVHFSTYLKDEHNFRNFP